MHHTIVTYIVSIHTLHLCPNRIELCQLRITCGTFRMWSVVGWPDANLQPGRLKLGPCMHGQTEDSVLPGTELTGSPTKTGRKACDTDVMTLALWAAASPVYCITRLLQRSRRASRGTWQTETVTGRPRTLGICLTE